MKRELEITREWAWMRWDVWCTWILRISILQLSNQVIQLLQKFLSLFLIYLCTICSSMSENSHWADLERSRFNTTGFIRIGFTNWDLWFFSHGDLLQACSEQRSCTDCHVSLFHLMVLNFGPQKLNSVILLENLQEFNLDLCSPIYSNVPQVSCLKMNSRRG